MTEREKKQQQWQKAQREQKSRQRTRSRWLKVLCSILWGVGILCGIAALVVDWLDAAISLIYLWLVLWTCAAWLNWYLAPDGYILQMGSRCISPFICRIPNLRAAIGISIFSVWMFLILL